MTQETVHVLDPCCGSRMMWFDKADPRAILVDATSQAMVWCWVSAWLGEPLNHPGAPGRALPT